MTFTATGSGANAGLSASVTFDDVAGNLVVTLDNTAAAGTTIDPKYLLTAVYFDIGSTSFSSGGVSSHGTVWDYVSGSWAPISADVGAYWEYKAGLSGTPNGQDAGLSSTGLGIFDQNGNLTTGTPGPLDGPPWGVSAGEPADTSAMQHNAPVVADEIVFVLNGLGGLLDNVSNVGFQYGTALDEPYLPGTPSTPVPEAGTLLAGTMLLLPLGASMLRILRKNRAV